MKHKTSVVLTVLSWLFFLIGIISFFGCLYIKQNFGISVEVLLYTILSPKKGTDANVVISGIKWALRYVLPAILFGIFLTVFVFFIHERIKIKITIGKKLVINLNFFIVFFVLSILFAIFSLFDTYMDLGFRDYFSRRKTPTTIYEDYYVNPNSVSITAPDNKKNLILVYLESMETTYASKEVGGFQERYNYIPNLTELANENISFSDKEKLGGFHSPRGTTWTMGAILAASSGIPFTFPVEDNSMNERETFASGLTTIGDFLKSEGYNNEFICGSDGDFAGRKQFFEYHGDYTVFDLFTAREKGYIAPDYYVWWGFEDKYLYDIAKDEATRLAAEDKPFNLTLLTVDTHFTGGYECSLCTDEYPTTRERVVSCADRQIKEFIDWCQQQPWYENTTIVIIGDHACMDGFLIPDNISYYDRTVYNCFINADFDKKDLSINNRVFTTLDLFPSILSSMGFKIEGDRLGLGTDLFSNVPTLVETMDYEWLQEETGKYSEYYINNFS